VLKSKTFQLLFNKKTSLILGVFTNKNFSTILFTKDEFQISSQKSAPHPVRNTSFQNKKSGTNNVTKEGWVRKLCLNMISKPDQLNLGFSDKSINQLCVAVLN